MTTNNLPPHTEDIGLDSLQSEFLSLRIGEEIPRLDIRKIRKVVDETKDNNLSNTDYKYLIESTDGKILTVSTWSLWRKISDLLKKAGKIQVSLELSHPGHDNYLVRLIP